MGWGRLRRPRRGPTCAFPSSQGDASVPTPHPLHSRPYGQPLPSSFFPSFFLNLTPMARNSLRPYASLWVRPLTKLAEFIRDEAPSNARPRHALDFDIEIDQATTPP